MAGRQVGGQNIVLSSQKGVMIVHLDPALVPIPSDPYLH